MSTHHPLQNVGASLLVETRDGTRIDPPVAAAVQRGNTPVTGDSPKRHHVPIFKFNCAFFGFVSSMLSSAVRHRLPAALGATRRHLSGVARTAAIKTLPSWTEVHHRNAIYKSFRFKSFKYAWHFMSRVAKVSEDVRLLFCILLNC